MNDFEEKFKKYLESNYHGIINSCEKLKKRENKSLEKISELRNQVKANKNICSHTSLNIFAAGSLGRLDSGENSDFDVFFTSDNTVSHIDEIHIFSEIIQISNYLKYPKFSNDGQYLKIFPINEKSTAMIGSPVDDQENWFTTRMLLLLESQWISSEKNHKDHLERILKIYFRDENKEEPFLPIFLMNDILRFWRTLCLNYEQARHKNTTTPLGNSWRKKNYNLKFSRMLSVFGTVLPLILIKNVTVENVVTMCSLSPIHRLAFGLHLMNDEENLLESKLKEIMNAYEYFLDTKESCKLDELESTTKKHLDGLATSFHSSLVEILSSKTIPSNMRQYLLV